MMIMPLMMMIMMMIIIVMMMMMEGYVQCHTEICMHFVTDQLSHLPGNTRVKAQIRITVPRRYKSSYR
jgi:hypothetical protein